MKDTKTTAAPPAAATTTNDASAITKKKKKKHIFKKKIPEKGDPDYLSPTQLRNRRKRKAKKKAKLQENNQPQQQQQTKQESSGKTVARNSNKNEDELKDPSMKYISYPTKTPIVRTAKKYIEPLLQLSNNNKNNSTFQVYIGPLYHWRTVSKLAVRPDTTHKHKVAIGLFAENSHSLLPVPKCKAHHPSINQVVEVVTQSCHELNVTPYESNTTENESKSEEEMGQLRYIGVNIDRSSGAAQLTLVWNGSSGEKDEVLDKLVGAILNKMVLYKSGETSGDGGEEPPMKKQRRRGRRGGDGKESQSKPISRSYDNNNNNSETIKGKVKLHSLWINYNSSWKHSNRIFEYDASCWRHVTGPTSITEHLRFPTPNKTEGQKGVANPTPLSYPVPLHFPPTVFRQANLDSFTNIVGRIRERVLKMDEKPFCVELYGGVGTIALNLSDAVSHIVSSDENPNNLKCFQESVKQLPAEIRPLLEYKQKNAADMVTSEADLFQKCELLILDPPRKGLEDEVIEFLCKGASCSSIKLLVYVSCGFQAFQRDCEQFLSSGRWRLDFAEGHVLFPGSDAIETLAFFVPK